MISSLLSLSQHPSILSPDVLPLYLDSLYFYQHSHTRKFKHSIQSLLTSLIKLGEFQLSASIISELTKDSISKVLPIKSSSHLSSLSPKSSSLSVLPLDSSNLSTKCLFSYIPNSYLQIDSFSFRSKADYGALILYTLSQHSTPLSRKDIERLSQKYLSIFPSLLHSSDWDSRYSSNRSRFCLFSNDFLRKATLAKLTSISSSYPSTFQLTSLGLSFVDSFSSLLPTLNPQAS